MKDTIKNFEQKFAHLKKNGLKVDGLYILDPKKKNPVIQISRPLIFDNRELPKRFDGFNIKSKIQGEMPKEFTVNRSRPDWHKFEYIWAPERFEKFVDRCGKEIKTKLNNPTMSRKEMLDALCFGDFQEHKNKSMQLIKEGKLPAYQKN